MNNPLSQVKLVVTDMDGTLLNSKGEVSARFFKLFSQLKQHDVQFVAASGRQYHSMAHKLNTIKDDIIIVAENGGVAKQNGKELFSSFFPKETIDEIIPLLRSIKNAYIVLCAQQNAYIETTDVGFVEFFSEFYTAYKTVNDLTEVTQDNFMKIAVYHAVSSEQHLYPFVKAYENKIQVKVSGEHWLDLAHIDTNKGNALKFLQQNLGVKEEETLVFGDYNNDLEMLQRAHFSYAMQNAHPNVKQTARFETKSNDEEGVEHILEQVLKAKKLVAHKQ